MTLAPGTRLGPYEIVSLLGAGGMGEVFRSRDTRLDRSVAIKVLPSEFTANAELRVRFEREAKSISQLNHPHICTLHDVGNHDGIEYAVMELIDGETLADVIGRGPLALRDVLKYGAQIADALHAAHRAGIVHRDLKPGNVMITKGGAKLLDFGLARSSAVATSADDLTIQKPLTERGTILGTFQYMSPEQLEGLDADERSDIFALGAVLYEMATGRRAFEGKTKTSLIAQIIGGEPKPLRDAQPLTPVALEHVVAKCLSKDPDERWQSAHDVSEELRWVASTSMPVAAFETKRGSAMIPWIIAATAVVAAIAGFAYLRPTTPSPQPLRFDIVAPPDVHLVGVTQRGGGAISPDGKRLVFVGREKDGVSHLYVRDLSQSDASVLPATEGATFPFWSPDSRSVGFFAGSSLKRADLGAAGSTIIVSNVDGRGGTWSKDGTVIFAPSSTSGLMRVAASGGDATPLLSLRGDQNSLRFPSFLPDGRHFLYYAQGARDGGIYIATVDGSMNRKLMSGAGAASFAPPAWLLFVRGDTLLAQKLNVDRGEMVGAPQAIGTGSLAATSFGTSGISVSNDGSLAYPAGFSEGDSLAWRDRNGNAQQVFVTNHEVSEASFAPDETRIVARSGASDLWEYDVVRGRSRRFTFGDQSVASAVWSVDGKRVIYTSTKGKTAIVARSADGSRLDTLIEPPRPLYPEAMTPDGTTLAVSGPTEKGDFDVSLLNLANGKLQPLLASPFNEVRSKFSPDGRFVAYTSDESGRPEVFVQRYPVADTKWQISAAGGDQVSWRGDGKELFYLAPDARMMSVEMKQEPVVSFGDPIALFATHLVPVSLTGNRNQYLVTRDGQRFLFAEPVESTSSRMAVVMNWQAALQTDR